MSRYLSLLLDCPVVIATIFICGIGGTFQYGFSISVMNSPSAFIQELVNTTCLHRYGVSLEQWQVSLIWSFTLSIFCIGGLLGSLVAGPLLSKCGRKQCLLMNNFVAIFGSLLMVLSQTAVSFEMIMAGRFLYGLNAGVGLSAHTMYLIECAPKRLRGMVGVTVATFVSLGKFCGQLLGISELLGTENGWPWLLGFNGFTALLQLLTLPFLPESPSFLLLDRADQPACDKALKKLWGNKNYSREIEEMLEEKAALQGVRNFSAIELIQNKSLHWQLLTITVTFFTLQLCGINAVYFYSFDVFGAAGIQENQLRYVALGTGLCEFCTSLTCFMIIESTGKKVLMYKGYMAMSAALVLLIITLYLQTYISWMPYCSMVLIFLFIFFFSAGPAGVTAPLPGEIFTQPFKSAAYMIASFTNWVGLFMLGMLFPVIVDNLDYFCFLIFLFFCILCGLFVKFNVPETKNRTVLEITAEFEKMHCKSGNSLRLKATEQKVNDINICETKF
ncbi:Solute carrier family 2, facilitated glucose transporter member 9 Glucose transporter type 9 [Channa argus]|uniref:Solute carrier family 2, facilitated glucose transporter member 5 n=1 Tax=Channa argus TaxID=215402 RepID=A0A6G1QI10_CHAAH|nr:Solute carrier family 2, facilitated glucose transporter member 9 Glucose transporter type 9 [Channa argus]